MAIPYLTAKFKSANTFKMAIWDPTAKFNSRQCFRLYGILVPDILRQVYYELLYLKFQNNHTSTYSLSLMPRLPDLQRMQHGKAGNRAWE